MKNTCLTTLCYLEQKDCYLMLFRNRKREDINEGKWIGIGGHLEQGESPEDCLVREVREETGLTLAGWNFRGIVTFCQETSGCQETSNTEYMFLYTSDCFYGELSPCQEGELRWIPKNQVPALPLWNGDLIFLDLLSRESRFFSLKLCYRGERLISAALDGNLLELLDIVDENNKSLGRVKERNCVHREGDWHRTAHVWIVRNRDDHWELLLQLRSREKDIYPGCYDISSAGHVSAGRAYRETALRELEEELGIKANPEDLKFLGYRKGETCQIFGKKPVKDREIAAVYLYEKTVKKEELSLQKEEVEQVEWKRLDEVEGEVHKQNPGYCVQDDEIRMLKQVLGNRKGQK